MDQVELLVRSFFKIPQWYVLTLEEVIQFKTYIDESDDLAQIYCSIK